MNRGERGKDRKTRLRKMTRERRREYYETIIYYRCNFCKRNGIFKAEFNMIEHLLEKHKFKLDEEDKIAFLRKYHGKTWLSEKECLEYGIDFTRFKKFRKEVKE